MIIEKRFTALFDLDGVVFDTENQYDIFWGAQGKKYLPHIENFHRTIKGQTLPSILSNFPEEFHNIIITDLNVFESEMPYNYIAGAKEFIIMLKENGIKCAVVTSSNDIKMANVYREHPDFTSLFDVFITANKVSRSKPDPQCFLLAAEELNARPEDCIVFEDSFHGLEAGKRASMTVIGLATTNPADQISHLADHIINDFTEITLNLN